MATNWSSLVTFNKNIYYGYSYYIMGKDVSKFQNLKLIFFSVKIRLSNNWITDFNKIFFIFSRSVILRAVYVKIVPVVSRVQSLNVVKLMILTGKAALQDPNG